MTTTVQINCETTFDTAERTMIQVFDNGAVLKYCFKTKKTGVFINEELKDTLENLTIDEYVRLQIRVQEM